MLFMISLVYAGYVHMSTEVKFIEVFEPMTDVENKLTHILI